MAKHVPTGPDNGRSTRRRFLERVGHGAVAGGVVGSFASTASADQQQPKSGRGQVAHRPLGKTGLQISEIGFGGHSWSYKRVPDEQGNWRVPSMDEATEMIAAGLGMGVNFFDSCTPHLEHTVPGEVIKRLNKRDKIVVSARCCHKMKGLETDKEEVYKFVDERLKMWQTDYFDLLMLSNTENDTRQSGLWEMSHSIEALEKVKQAGKVRFVGFGSHFTPTGFVYAMKKYGADFDVCSMPYNIRHRAAEKIIPLAKQAGMGMVTIKPFARGSLLKDRDLEGAEKGLPREMISFVLENELLDACICGVHTPAHVQENFSASWTKLEPGRRGELETLAANVTCRDSCWLEEGWLHA